MSTGNLIFLLLIVGGLFVMFSMHRGGHAMHRGGHAHGMGGGCGGHGPDHGRGTDERAEEEKKPLVDKPGQYEEHGEPAEESGKHRGC